MALEVLRRLVVVDGVDVGEDDLADPTGWVRRLVRIPLIHGAETLAADSATGMARHHVSLQVRAGEEAGLARA